MEEILGMIGKGVMEGPITEGQGITDLGIAEKREISEILAMVGVEWMHRDPGLPSVANTMQEMNYIIVRGPGQG